MAVVYMTYPVHPDKETAFQNAYAGILDVMRSADGHRESRLFKHVAEPSIFLIVSEWDSKAAYEAFVNSKQFSEATSDWGKSNILLDQPRHHIIET
ncbi:MAG: antibiotic biosynthesis monooxygenase [candidate division Zixibacteria bacterium]|nr:antibiotic biosynthesis monooxygenase [candidate division Zixibacteria bacterium]